MKPKRVGVYIRISTGEQNPDLQKHELPEYSERRGWQVVQTYIDACLLYTSPSPRD